jgi:hypothetical protein
MLDGAPLMSRIDLIGYAAALTVLGSFCMSTIVPLRMLGIVSNLLFGLYGLLAHLYPVFLLHLILLPINIFKLARLRWLAPPAWEQTLQMLRVSFALRRKSMFGMYCRQCECQR